MDIFQKYLLKKEEDDLVKKALTDSSFVISVSNSMAFYNSNYMEILDSIVSNEELVLLFNELVKKQNLDISVLNNNDSIKKIIRYYNLTNYIDRDPDNPSEDYIIKVIKAMLYVIYKKSRSIAKINQLLKEWSNL